MNTKILKKIEKEYDKILDLLIEEVGDDVYDFVIELTTYSGETVRISWKDREDRLYERDTASGGNLH